MKFHRLTIATTLSLAVSVTALPINPALEEAGLYLAKRMTPSVDQVSYLLSKRDELEGVLSEGSQLVESAFEKLRRNENQFSTLKEGLSAVSHLTRSFFAKRLHQAEAFDEAETVNSEPVPETTVGTEAEIPSEEVPAETSNDVPQSTRFQPGEIPASFAGLTTAEGTIFTP